MALTLLPLIISCGLCGLGAFWFIEQKEQLQWLCEVQNLEAQKALVEGMNQLIKLNPIIESKVLEKKFVKLAIKMAPTPGEKAALRAQLVLLNAQLSRLMTEQKIILFSTHKKAGKNIGLARKRIADHILTMGRRWNSKLTVKFLASKVALRLQKKKVDPLGYLYLEHLLLSTQQEISLRLFISGERLFPKWLGWLSQQPLRWQESCKSRPIKENNKWNATLTLDKL